MESCPECGDDNFVIDWRQGDTICTECGLIVDSRMIMDQPLPDKLHGSEKLAVQKEGTSIALSISRKRSSDGSFKMIENLQKGLHTSTRANCDYLDEVCNFRLRLPSCITDCAKELVGKVFEIERQSSRGKNLIGLQACSVYHACVMQRQEGVARSIPEIVCAFDIVEPVFTKANHRLKTALEGTKYHKFLFETNKSSDLVYRSIDHLSSITSKATKNIVKKSALRILQDFEEKKLLQERTTSSVAAVAIYLAVRDSGHKMPMSKFTAETGLTGQATLSMILKQLERQDWKLTECKMI